MPRILSEEISAEDFEPIEFSWQEEKSSGDFIFKKAESLLPENKKLASDLFLNERIRPIENLISKCRYQSDRCGNRKIPPPRKRCGRGRRQCDQKDQRRRNRKRDRSKTSNELAKFNY